MTSTQVVQVELPAFEARGRVIKLAMLMTHYRSPINWTEVRLAEATAAYLKFLRNMEPSEESPSEDFLEALADDLNTPKAIAIMHGYVKSKERNKLYAAMLFLGLLA